MTRRPAGVVLGVLALALTGCAVTPPGPTAGPTAPATSPSVSATAAPSPSAIAVEVPRWTVETLSRNDPTRPVHVQWPVVPGATTLTALLAEESAASEAAFLANTTPSDVAPPELRGTWETVLDGPAWVGVRLSLYEFAGASGNESSAVYYGERTAGQALHARDLIAPSARHAAADALVSTLRAEGREVLEELVTNAEVRDRLLQDLSFSPRGELVARIPEGTVLSFSDGVVTATLAPSVVEGLLSEQGWAVREDVTGLVASPSATPVTSVKPAPAASVDCTVAQCVALTFDDGPGRHTARLLDDLDSLDAPATFFMLGASVRVAPDLVRRMAAEGHEVGNHTYDHRQLTKLGPDRQRAQVERAQAAIAGAGVRATVFRPPYGSYDATTREVAGLPIILWDVDTLDWKHRSTEQTTSIALRDARAGSIVLMHDIHASTVDAVPGVVAGLRERGFTLVTVSQLLGDAAPGSVHRRR